eukprot:TRINITY_DN788_c0_g1_i1.p1 TRINITY_DN788_c0_g1~~TRINITY_DN788_c0_g1_i1.p1  ORF type:complete len:1170 (-),score=280.30 TRINITY_DN788_c0_g1_i1:213-3722(-)
MPKLKDQLCIAENMLKSLLKESSNYITILRGANLSVSQLSSLNLLEERLGKTVSQSLYGIQLSLNYMKRISEASNMVVRDFPLMDLPQQEVNSDYDIDSLINDLDNIAGGSTKLQKTGSSSERISNSGPRVRSGSNVSTGSHSRGSSSGSEEIYQIHAKVMSRNRGASINSESSNSTTTDSIVGIKQGSTTSSQPKKPLRISWGESANNSTAPVSSKTSKTLPGNGTNGATGGTSSRNSSGGLNIKIRLNKDSGVGKRSSESTPRSSSTSTTNTPRGESVVLDNLIMEILNDNSNLRGVKPNTNLKISVAPQAPKITTPRSMTTTAGTASADQSELNSDNYQSVNPSIQVNGVNNVSPKVEQKTIKNTSLKLPEKQHEEDDHRTTPTLSPGRNQPKRKLTKSLSLLSMNEAPNIYYKNSNGIGNQFHHSHDGVMSRLSLRNIDLSKIVELSPLRDKPKSNESSPTSNPHSPSNNTEDDEDVILKPFVGTPSIFNKINNNDRTPQHVQHVPTFSLSSSTPQVDRSKQNTTAAKKLKKIGSALFKDKLIFTPNKKVTHTKQGGGGSGGSGSGGDDENGKSVNFGDNPNTPGERTKNLPRSFSSPSSSVQKVTRPNNNNASSGTTTSTPSRPKNQVNVDKFPPIIVKKIYQGLRVDEPFEKVYNDEDDMLKTFHRDGIENKLALDYRNKENYNFLVKESETEHSFITVMGEAYIKSSTDLSIHKAVKTAKRGNEELNLTVDPPSSSSPSLTDRLEDSITLLNPGKQILYINDQDCTRELSEFEAKYPQKREAIKLGVIYCKPGQLHPKEMFTNNEESCSSYFWDFMNSMGGKIELSTWKKYRGDMGTEEGQTYYYHWNEEVEVIYHVAPIMGVEGHRRLIGNDVAVIFFQDEGEFDPTFVDELGTVPQIYAVVQPYGEKKDTYHMAFMSKLNIKPFGPDAPFTALSPRIAKELLLTKLYNGLTMTTFCPPLNRLFYVPRGEVLESMATRLRCETRKERRAREKQMPSITNSTSLTQSLVAKVHLFTNDEDPNVSKIYKQDCQISITKTSIDFIDLKSGQKIHTWKLSQLLKWTFFDAKKVFKLEFGSQKKDIIVFKSSEPKKIENFLSEVLQGSTSFSNVSVSSSSSLSNNSNPSITANANTNANVTLTTNSANKQPTNAASTKVTFDISHN